MCVRKGYGTATKKEILQSEAVGGTSVKIRLEIGKLKTPKTKKGENLGLY